eukprot:4485610-Pyramimonas_sp.AAC.1
MIERIYLARPLAAAPTATSSSSSVARSPAAVAAACSLPYSPSDANIKTAAQRVGAAQVHPHRSARRELRGAEARSVSPAAPQR